MAISIINEINKFRTFRYDTGTNRIINMRFEEETDIDEFLDIQYILDKNNIEHKFDKNFDIKIIGN